MRKINAKIARTRTSALLAVSLWIILTKTSVKQVARSTIGVGRTGKQREIQSNTNNVYKLPNSKKSKKLKWISV